MAARIIYRDGNELAAFIVRAKGPVTIEAITEPKTTVKSRLDKTPKAEVYPHGLKRVRHEYAWVGSDYETLVNRQQSREGGPADFESAPLPWGQYVEGSRVVIEYGGKYYMRYYRKVNANAKATRTRWVNGHLAPLTVVEESRLGEFLPKRDEQRMKERQGVEDIVEPRTISLDNVTRLCAGGRVYVKHGYLSQEEAQSISNLHRQFEGALNGYGSNA